MAVAVSLPIPSQVLWDLLASRSSAEYWRSPSGVSRLELSISTLSAMASARSALFSWHCCPLSLNFSCCLDVSFSVFLCPVMRLLQHLHVAG